MERYIAQEAINQYNEIKAVIEENASHPEENASHSDGNASHTEGKPQQPAIDNQPTED